MATISNSKSNTLITGMSAADNIYNDGNRVTIKADKGNDSVLNEGGSVSIDTGDDHDIIRNTGSKVTIDGGAGNDYVYTNSGDVTINSGAGNDTVHNYGRYTSSINTGNGNDSIHNEGNLVTVDTGNGDDSVYSVGDFVTIDGGAGNDSISNYYGFNVSINTNNGNDTIYNYGSKVTIDGGADNDSIQNYGDTVTINGGDGNDFIFSGDKWVIICGDSVTIDGGDGDDTIYNYGNHSTINGGDGNDSIYNIFSSVTIDAGADDDSITNAEGDSVTIAGGDGNDTIRLGNYAENNLIQYTAGDGNDTVYGFNDDDTLKIGTNNGYTSVKSGKDLIIKVGDGSITFKDGADLSLNIETEAVEETLSSAEIELRNSAAKALEDFIAIGAGTAKKSSSTSDVPNADTDDEEDLADQVKNSELDVIRLFGGVFELMTKYKLNADGTLMTDSSGNLIEVESSSRDVILAGYGSLLNADSILTSARKLASGKLSKEEGTAEITNIVNQAGEIAKNIVTVKGSPGAVLITSLGVSVFGLVTNVMNAFTSGMDKDLAQDFANNFKSISQAFMEKVGSTAQLKNTGFGSWITGKAAGTRVETFVNKVCDITAERATKILSGTLFAAVGVYSAIDTLCNSISRYEVDGLPTASKVINTTIDVVGDVIHTASNAAVLALTGGILNADTIYRGVHFVGSAIKWSLQSGWAMITGGDPSQVKFQVPDDRNFTEVIGDALKNLITNTTSAKDVINEKRKKVYTTNGDNNITNYVSECVITSGTGNDYIFNIDGVYGTNIDAGNDDDKVFVRYRDNAVFGGQGNDEIMVSTDGKSPAYGNQIDGGPGDDQIVINESEISSGSKKANTVAGGEGNDRIMILQSKTPVVIRYNVDDGEDYIGGYDSKDTIQIVNGNYTTTKSGDNVIIKVGNGAMTLLGAANEKLNIEKISNDVPPEGISYNGKKTKLTAYTTFRREQINLANYAPTVKQVNASSLVNEVNITGNALNNSIRGGKNSDTLDGGDGDDTLKGEKGNDTIYGGDGDDKIDAGKGRDIIFGGKGNDSLKGGDDVDLFVYVLGDDNDTIDDFKDTDLIQFVDAEVSKTQIVGSNVVFTFNDGGTLTVKKGKGKKFTVLDANGEHIYDSTVIKSSSSNDPKLLVLDNSHKSTVTLDFPLITADASARTKKIEITGNVLDNVLIGGTKNDTLNGGTGNDVLTGGKGNDVFIYDSDDDTITDYESGDKISVNSAMKNFSTDGNNVIINYEDGSLTVDNAVGKKITFIENGKTYVNVYSADGISNNAGTAITLPASATTDSKLVSIDGSAVTGQLEIVGNENAKKIIAGKDDTTLNGGGGNDILWGGNRADTFIYDDNSGKDTIIGFDNNDMLQLSNFTASVKNNKIFFQVASQKNAVTLQDFTATTFNINGDIYRVQDNKLTK